MDALAVHFPRRARASMRPAREGRENLQAPEGWMMATTAASMRPAREGRENGRGLPRDAAEVARASMRPAREGRENASISASDAMLSRALQ